MKVLVLPTKCKFFRNIKKKESVFEVFLVLISVFLMLKNAFFIVNCCFGSFVSALLAIISA